jgi:uncharacterized protein YdhG (YjbR/CyaY superfamily)
LQTLTATGSPCCSPWRSKFGEIVTQKRPTKTPKGFTDEEKAAMRERARELKSGGNDGEEAVLAKLKAMTGSDRVIGERLHAIVKATAPGLSPKLWYGMPAYADKDGKVVCFYQDSRKFKTRYATIGFSDKATLDDGHIWPVYFAVTELTAADEAKVVALLRRAVG